MNCEIYIEKAFVPIVMLTVIYFNSLINSPYHGSQKIFRCVLLDSIAVYILDTALYISDGKVAGWSRQFLEIGNTLIFILIYILAYSWFCYVFSMLFENEKKLKKILIISAIPILIITIIALFNLKFNIFFTIDGVNTYHRTNVFFFQAIIVLLYPVSAMVVAIIKYFKEKNRTLRYRALSFSLFSLLAIAGAIIQVSDYGAAIMLPCISISLLILYISLCNQQISTDALTGLNNRGNFDKYIHSCCNDKDFNKELYLVIMDIDNFKTINDKFGHVLGDEALIKTAEIIKHAFGPTKAFLARYGGDEFAAVIEITDNAYNITDLFRHLEKAQNKINNESNLPFPITISKGYAKFGTKTTQNVKQFIAVADREMYKEKEINHKNNSFPV